MTPMIASLPVQILCQLIAQTPSFNGTNLDTVTVNQIQPTELPHGYVAYPDIGFAYKVHNKLVSWKVARKECIIEGSQLALIDSYTKLEHVLRQNQSKNMTHVGIVRMYDDEEWVSVATGFPVSVIPWADGEPGGDTDCVMIKPDENGLGNFGCHSYRGNYVCELPIPQNYNVQGNVAVDIPVN